MFLLDACRRPHNFREELSPRYISNSYTYNRPSDHNTFTVVSYNIEKGKNINGAIKLIDNDSTLAAADVFLLQEMDELGTKTIAEAFGLNYIYFPINSNYSKTKDFGSSILSKDSIIEEHKLILPHGQFHNNRLRGVTIAKIIINNKEIALASAHLATVFMSSNKRKNQVNTIATHFKDSIKQEAISVVGGDFNAVRREYRQYISQQMRSVGFTSSTQGLGATHGGKLPFIKPEMDIIFARNLKLITKGKVIDKEVSDHFPIWATFSLK